MINTAFALSTLIINVNNNKSFVIIYRLIIIMNKKAATFVASRLRNCQTWPIGTCFTGLPGARGPSWAPHAVSTSR